MVSVESILESLESLKGKRVILRESISRNRSAGHDRHFATVTEFLLQISDIEPWFSGGQIRLIDSSGNGYGISIESTIRLHREANGTIVIDEQFEQETERRTTISIVNC